MKVISSGRNQVQQEDSSSRKEGSARSIEEIQESLKALDQSLGAYFGEPETVEKKTPDQENLEIQRKEKSILSQDEPRPPVAEQDSISLDSSSTTTSEHTTWNPIPQASSTNPSTTESEKESPSKASSQDQSNSSTSPTEAQIKVEEAVKIEKRREMEAERAATESDLQQEQAKGEVMEEEEYDAATEVRSTPLRPAKVPSSRLGRLFHYGSLGAGLAWGAAGEMARGGGGKQGVFMSESNVKRLVDKLSTMRGAALKLGQFMSIQDSNLLPEQIEQVLLRVQNSANYMPAWQMEKVMNEDLGPDWRESFESFQDVPFASASIGQVHSAVLSKSHSSNLAGKRVAVKVQFPGVRESIVSDLSNLKWLLSASAILPKGLFLENTIKVMSRELDDECDYEREAEMGAKFYELLKDSKEFAVPEVVKELCGKRVLTTEMMRGRPLTQAKRFGQEKRNQVSP